MNDDTSLLVDLHSHLVPGVDDGARTVDDALAGLGRMLQVGIRHVVTTPHASGSLTRVPADFESWVSRVDEKWARLREAAAGSFPTLHLRRGHEVMLDVPDPDLSDPRLRLDGTSWVLVEWPRLQIPPGTVPVIQRLTQSGVRPLIAHPERYAGLDRDGLGLADQWRQAGARLQCNYGSLLGRYGPHARTAAIRLLKRGWIDCMSTDFHGRAHLKLFVRESRELFENAAAEEAWAILTGTNARRILNDEEPLPVPPVEFPTNLWGRMRELFGRT